MGFTTDLILANIKRSLAPKTWDSYISSWNDWNNFCDSFSNSCNYPLLELMLCFITSLMSRNLSATHISKILAGISFCQKIQGITPVNNNFLVRQALKGYRKNFPRVDNRRPITFDILSKLIEILPAVCSSSFESTLFRAAFTLAFFAALRISEFTAASKNVNSNLKRSDIYFSNNSLKIHIFKSKTDQLGKGTWIDLHPIPSSNICPLKMVSDYLSIRPYHFTNFFIHSDFSPLTKYQFNSILKKCLLALGLHQYKLTSHSFRIGAATEAARLGLSAALIKKIGRWESERFCIYVRPNLILNV